MPFLLIAALAAMAPQPPAPVPHEVVRSRLAACGLDRGRMSVRYDDVFEEDVVMIAPGPVPSRATMQCMAGVSLATIYEIHFAEARTQETYNPIYLAAMDATDRRHARNWLRKRGKLATLPRHNSKQTLASYARRLESYCGVRPGSMLMAFSADLLTVARQADPMKIVLPKPGFTCLMRAISASDLRQHGIIFGFVGNKADDPEN